MIRKIRIVLWLLVGVLGSYVGYYTFTEPGYKRASTSDKVAEIGGPFSIASTKGGRLTNEDLLGKPWMLFFGFTYCPDVCPTTLLEMTQWLKELGDKSKDLQAVFVTVDPERDNIEHLTEYMSSFDKRIIGLSPTIDELAKLAKDYKIYYKKVPNDDGDDYSMDHSSAVLLFDRNGQFRSTVDYHEDPKTAVKKLDLLQRR